MKKQQALKATLIISSLGTLFSGYLAISELFFGVCPLNGGCTYVLWAPSCVYGLGMFLSVLVVSLLGLKSKK